LPPPPIDPGKPPAPDGPIVINPKGKAPTFTLRDSRFVSSVQVKDALARKQRMVIVDARPLSDFVREHIPGSISIPHYETAKLDKIPSDAVVIAYCACPHHASGIIVDELLKRGHKKAYVLDEGILFWRKQGYPIAGSGAASGAAGIPAPPPHDHAHHDHAHHGHAH
jgi:rhodanese-related sulfurtransferase